MSREFTRVTAEYFTLTDDIIKLHYYKMLLRNKERMRRYQEAIDQKVGEDDIVLEIGSGLGTLSFMAAKRARRVYAVEKDERILDLSKQVAKRNGLDGKIEFVLGNSFDVEIPEPATVLLLETFGDLALEYNLLGCVMDARERLLVTNPKIIPENVSLFLAPFYSERVFNEQNGFWGDILGIDYCDVKTVADKLSYMRSIASNDNVADPALFLEVDLATTESTEIDSSVTFSFPSPTRINGFAGYFETTLSEGNVFSTRPDSKNNSFRQYCFPMPGTLDVEEIEVRLRNNPKGKEEVVKWGFDYRVK